MQCIDLSYYLHNPFLILFAPISNKKNKGQGFIASNQQGYSALPHFFKAVWEIMLQLIKEEKWLKSQKCTKRVCSRCTIHIVAGNFCLDIYLKPCCCKILLLVVTQFFLVMEICIHKFTSNLFLGPEWIFQQNGTSTGLLGQFSSLIN